MSRYHVPGSVMDCLDSSDLLGKAVVIATSRHKDTCGESEALALLAAAIDGPHTEPEFVQWRSVVRADWDNVPADEGGWHTEGSGAAWMTALCSYPLAAEGDER